ncbi:MAG: oligosaccharide flippase family protein [Ignavibacteria bacterium]
MNFLSSLKKSVSVSKHLFAYQVGERAFFFVFFLLIARTLPTEIFGEFSSVFTLAGVICIFFDFGLPIHLQKTLAEKRHNNSKIVSEALWFFVFISMLSLILSLIIISRFYSQTNILIIFLITFSVILMTGITNLNAILLAHQKYKNILTSLIWTRPLIIFFTLILLLTKHAQIEYYAGIWLAGIVFQILTLVWYLRNLNLKIILPTLRNILLLVTTTGPLGVAVVFNYLYDKVDVLLISKILDFSQVAYYAVPYGIYKSTSLAFGFLLVSGLNRISSVSRRTSAIWLFFKYYSRFLLVISLPLSFLLFVLSDKILLLLYGNVYVQSTLVLKILSLGLIGMSLNNLTGVILNGIGKYKVNMYIVMSAFLSNIIVNYLLLPYYGIVASAVITVITEYYIFFVGFINILKLEDH